MNPEIQEGIDTRINPPTPDTLVQQIEYKYKNNLSRSEPLLLDRMKKDLTRINVAKSSIDTSESHIKDILDYDKENGTEIDYHMDPRLSSIIERWQYEKEMKESEALQAECSIRGDWAHIMARDLTDLTVSSEEREEKEKFSQRMHDISNNLKFYTSWVKFLKRNKDLPVGSEEEQGKQKLSDRMPHFSSALRMTTEQVQYLTEAEVLPVRSKEREEKENMALKKDFDAKQEIYLTLKDEYETFEEKLANQLAESQRTKKIKREEIRDEILEDDKLSKQEKDKQILTIERKEFPEWLYGKTEKSKLYDLDKLDELKERRDKIQQDNQLSTQERDEQIDEIAKEEETIKSKKKDLRQIASRQVELFFPDATQAQKESIMYDWLETKSADLVKAEEKWNEDLASFYGLAKRVLSYNTSFEGDREKFSKLKPEELCLAQHKFALQETYKTWTDPDRLQLELTPADTLLKGELTKKGKGWGAAIIRTILPKWPITQA